MIFVLEVLGLILVSLEIVWGVQYFQALQAYFIKATFLSIRWKNSRLLEFISKK